MIFELATASGFGDLVTPSVNVDLGEKLNGILGVFIPFFPAVPAVFDPRVVPDRRLALLSQMQSLFHQAIQADRNHTNLGELDTFFKDPTRFRLTPENLVVIKEFLSELDRENLEQMVLMSFLFGAGDWNDGSLVPSVTANGTIRVLFVDFEVWSVSETGNDVPECVQHMLPQLSVKQGISTAVLRLIDQLDGKEMQRILSEYGVPAFQVDLFMEKVAILQSDKEQFHGLSLLEIKAQLKQTFEEYTKSMYSAQQLYTNKTIDHYLTQSSNTQNHLITDALFLSVMGISSVGPTPKPAQLTPEKAEEFKRRLNLLTDKAFSIRQMPDSPLYYQWTEDSPPH
jgi:hypothetical protein